ncbi:MAG: DUF1801 domain-containing protein [Bacteroidetes bacterium]|nr:DUF1801 domain-containing protein [Bacteroidota bacterium]
MAKTPKKTEAEELAEHINNLEPNIREAVLAVRNIILSIDIEIGERIKWNNPSYYYKGEMKAFDPKEYKREIAVFNLFKGRMMLVFPSGAKLNDTTGLLEGKYEDGRRLIVFKDIADVKTKEKQLRAVIRKWLKLVVK